MGNKKGGIPHNRERFIEGQVIGDQCIYIRDAESKPKHRRVVLKCRCGNEFTAALNHIKSKRSTSCGCVNSKLCKERATTHGMSTSEECRIWSKMKNRILDPKSKDYKNYGGRGLKLDPKWENSFQEFYNSMGPRPSKNHSIGRINNDIGYFDFNCTWETIDQQNTNKRNNVKITKDGETLTISQWAKKLGMNPTTIGQRLKKNWNIEDILSTKKRINQFG